jgi:rfaE bifunctional protein nucleotidyltransferase chain/domain
METLDYIKSKIFDRETLLKQVAVWRFLNQKIIFTNGCFDILHLGHVEYLSRAKDLGGKLVIGLNSDRSVRMIKGPGRPVMDEKTRSTVLAAFAFIDAVVLFDEETPFDLIRSIMPEFLVKGNDYKPAEIVGHEVVEAGGGQVVTIELTPGYSTTSVVNRILVSEKQP